MLKVFRLTRQFNVTRVVCETEQALEDLLLPIGFRFRIHRPDHEWTAQGGPLPNCTTIRPVDGTDCFVSGTKGLELAMKEE